MTVENVKELNNITGYLMFTISFENEQNQEVSLEVSCAEDIEMQMEMFFKQKWEDLFNEWYDPFNFMYATFNGIRLINNDKDRVNMQIYGNYKLGSASFDLA